MAGKIGHEPLEHLTRAHEALRGHRRLAEEVARQLADDAAEAAQRAAEAVSGEPGASSAPR